MFKNALFLKIILIFTLPALGILYFSSVLVYEKIKSFNEIDGIQKNIVYLKNTEKLLNSVQKERELTVLHILERKDKSDLNNQRLLTNKAYIELENTRFSLDMNFSQVKFEIEKLEQIRKKIDDSDIPLV
ncbi:MAG: nitrate- and nitrite sensing domain-containing protein [Aliarcobacter sp.]|nr:nitrate- and nitrite sensing domain-containing protein [Aliarcobacter sp.]